ncbi:ribonuclease [Agrobacterium sp. DSM 25558]|uniref:ribonuclease T2 family protein n=1 Tax=Agrobacterium sp. DSM 25558 TaxID=1907665 RepID=UPI00097D3C9C|nr:ribonuclease [Agrobacterium sp. DSM 25558]
MKQYAGFIALGALSLAAAGWFMFADQKQETPRKPITISATAPSPMQTPQPPVGSGFDFYVLSLSWSPAFCASDAGQNSRQQCGGDRKYGFIVHGLWPQNESGYPEFCGKDKQERVPDSLGSSMFDIMPSMGLIGHQWRKHGSCSGLSQKDYLDTIRAAYQRVNLPKDLSSGTSSKTLSADAVETAFIADNPGMTKQGLAISCDGPRLEEVRICMNKDLGFRSCPEVDRKGCRSNTTEIIPIR